MLHIEEYVGIILGVPQTHRARALANPHQPHSAVVHELQRYIEAHNPDASGVNVVSATDAGQDDTSHQPVRHWYHVTYEAAGVRHRTPDVDHEA